MASRGAPSERTSDWWRWTALIPVAGSVPLVVVALRRRQWLWATLVVLVNLGEVACFALAGARPPHSHAQSTTVGAGVLVWLLALVLAWTVPNPGAPAPYPAVTERARRLTVRYGLGAYVATFAVALAVALILRGAGVRHLGVGVGVLIVDGGLLVSLIPLLHRHAIGPRDLGLRPTRLGATGLAIGALITYLVLSVLWAAVVIHPTSSTQPLSRQLGIPLHPGLASVVIDVLAVAISAPVSEEIFFRGLLFRSLRNRLALWPAAIIAGCLFGLVHLTSYPLNTIPIKMLFGVLMCLLYERTGSLLPCIAVHATVDGSSIDAALTGNIVIAASLIGALLVGLGLTALVRSARTPYAERGTYVPPAHLPPRDPDAPAPAWPPYLRDD